MCCVCMCEGTQGNHKCSPFPRLCAGALFEVLRQGREWRLDVGDGVAMATMRPLLWKPSFDDRCGGGERAAAGRLFLSL